MRRTEFGFSLVLFIVVLFATGIAVFSYGLRYARHAGTLAQY